MWYSAYVKYINRIISRASYGAAGAACLLVLICVCVIAQMLGTPFTLLSLLNSDMLAELEPVSEDLSAFSPPLEPERSRLFLVFTEFRPLLHQPVLLTSVFHPPSA